MLSENEIIDILKALADPNRLHLFELLLQSDCTNSELMNETGLSQNLLSHHLTVLTDTGLVKAHQSIGDARRRYYSPNLTVTQRLGLWWSGIGLAPTNEIPRLKKQHRVLFLCARNAARSLVAEAVARHLAAGAIIACSAGIEPGGEFDPTAMRQVLAEHGVPGDDVVPQAYDPQIHMPVDVVVTVCDRVHESALPEQLTGVTYVHWSLADPVEETEDPTERLVLMRELYDEIVQRLTLLVQRLAASEQA